MKILIHLVLAFMFVSQTLSLQGCTRHVKVFECKANCNDTILECRTAVDVEELEIP